MRTLQVIAVIGGLTLTVTACNEHTPAEVGTADLAYPPSSEYDEDFAELEQPVPAPVVETPVTQEPSAPQVYEETNFAGTDYRKTLRESGWTRIGDRDVEKRSDRGKIGVGRGERHVSELVLLVQDAPIEIYNMTVMFADGTSYSPSMTQRFRPGTHSQVIQLPAYHAPVKSIQFRYGTLYEDDEAKVEVWGR